MKINSPLGKQTLALVRGGDYAHAGGEEAIDLLFSTLPKSQSSRVLDVGCGIGGTADYVQRHGWGEVTGVDLDPANIAVAQERHPGVTFLIANALELSGIAPEAFDIICLFNSFYAFSDQPKALTAMRRVAKPDAKLAIFDYADRREDRTQPWLGTGTSPFTPIDTARVESVLRSAGWKLEESHNLDTEYLRWYATLVDQIRAKERAIAALGGNKWFAYLLNLYEEMRNDIQQKRLGGGTSLCSPIIIEA